MMIYPQQPNLNVLIPFSHKVFGVNIKKYCPMAKSQQYFDITKFINDYGTWLKCKMDKTCSFMT